jgi:AraC-like DNA-binding protein
MKVFCSKCRGPWIDRLPEDPRPWLCTPCVRRARLESLPLEKLDPDGKTRAILASLEDESLSMQDIARLHAVSPPRVARVFRDRRELPAVLALWEARR